MTDLKPTLRARLTKLRTDPRIAAFSLIGPGGQIFDLVDVLVSELEVLDSAGAELLRLIDNQAAHLAKLAAELERQAEAVRRQAAAIAELEARAPTPARTTAAQHPLRSR